MAVSKRKSASITAEAPMKKVKKESKEAKANTKTLFGKAIKQEGQEENEDEDEGELEAEPIRDDDEENSMEVDSEQQAAPQRPKIRKQKALFLCTCSCISYLRQLFLTAVVFFCPYRYTPRHLNCTT